jgi:hypothetical protein
VQGFFRLREEDLLYKRKDTMSFTEYRSAKLLLGTTRTLNGRISSTTILVPRAPTAFEQP